MKHNLRDEDIKTTTVVSTPFKTGFKIGGHVYINSGEILGYIHREVAKGKVSHEIMANLQRILNGI